MILDNALVFDTAASVAIGVGTQASTNMVNLVNARDLGIGTGESNTPKLMVLVTTAFTTTNAATLQVSLQGSTASGSGFVTYASSPAIAAANLTAGAQLLNIDMPRPSPGASLPQFLQLLYTVATGTFSTGNLTAALVLERGDIVSYPPGVTVAN